MYITLLIQMSNENQSYKSLSDTGSSNNIPSKDFFLREGVLKGIKGRPYTPFDVVKILLRERAMKQTDLAREIGMSKQALHNYICGRFAVPTQIKLKIAQALNVDSAVIWDFGRRE